MITVHHLNNSRSQRILWMLEELGVPYRIERHQRDPKTSLAPQSLRAIHPLGKSPVITDGAVTLAESGAILEYLVDRYGAGRFVPAAGSPERTRYAYWMHFAEGSAMPYLVMKLVFDRIESAPMPFFARPIARAIARKAKDGFVQPNIDRAIGYVESELGRGTWFAGEEFTAADVQMSFPLEAAQSRSDLSACPNIRAFLDRIHARPAYVRARDQGGDFEILGSPRASRSKTLSR